jgi:hypothetical protein
MDEKTLEALKGSIKKWEDIRDGLIDDKGTRNCPLCKMFSVADPIDDCVGCPIAEAVDDIHCYGTPYSVFNAFDNKFTMPLTELTNEDDIAMRRRLAQDEIDFLASLLPKE